MKLIINKDRSVIPIGTWGTKNENDFEIVDFEFPEELEGYNKRIVYLLGGGDNPWNVIDRDNKAYITSEITSKENVKGYVWCTKENRDRPADTDFRSREFDIPFYENEPATGVVPTPQQVDGFNTMLTAMNAKIDEVDALEQTIETAEAERQENENTRISNESTRESNESTRQTNEQTRQSQEADRERRTNEAISSIQDKTAEYNANAEEKTNEFNDLVHAQELAIENYGDTQLNAIGKKGKQALSSITTTTRFALQDISLAQQTGVSAVETASSEAITNFNTNATNKTNAFNNNATEKTTAFDNNASAKTSEFNTNAESKTTAFNENATQKTTNFDNNASEKTDEFNTNAQNKIDEYDEHIVEYQAQIDELQEEVEELSENMPWNTTEQATEIQVTDAAKYSKNKLELFGNTEQMQYTGKNLFNVENSHFGWGDYSFNLVDNIITIRVGDGNGGLAPGSQGQYTDFNFDTNKEYYFSVYRKTGYLLYKEASTSKWSRVMLYIKYEDGSTSNLFVTITSTTEQVSKKITFTEGKTPVAYAIGRYLPGNTLENNQSQDFYVQLEEGTEATDYEPYVGGQPAPSPDYPQPIHVVTGNNTISVGNTNYQVNLGSLELCKIGDYQDYLYKENGNWYKYGAINKLILTENANIFSVPYGVNSYGLHVPGNSYMSVIADKIIVISNKYKGIKYNDRVNEISNSIYEASRQDTIHFRNTQFETVEDFKTNNIGTILYVVLNTPTTTQITDETLIAQLDAIYEHLQLVKGKNNITVTAEDLSPYMQLSYMQDLKSKLDNLDSRLALLE